MPRPIDIAKRNALIEQTAVYLSDNGFIDTSLRDVAAGLGTTSRMLVYYFGTKEALFTAALESRRQNFRLAFDAVSSPEEFVLALRSLLREMTAGSKEPEARLLIQILGAGTAGNGEYRAFASAAIADMTTALRDAILRMGGDARTAGGHATVIGAAFRGLLIDRLTSTAASEADQEAETMFSMLADLAAGRR
ncbi:TetR/AcrR family transcriptional regulator [Gordonia effusa]|nr:TetR/AcrR family transcriptional regulator [Gordonia effusa]